jgi:hypothetical protein
MGIVVFNLIDIILMFFKEISLNKINYLYVKQMYIIDYAIRTYNTDSVKQWDNHN